MYCTMGGEKCRHDIMVGPKAASGYDGLQAHQGVSGSSDREKTSARVIIEQTR